MKLKYFNSRPHGGRPENQLRKNPYSHFNSRPHGGRRCIAVYKCYRISISTHALTEGDDNKAFIERPSGISTHALTEGDEAYNLYYRDDDEFQLTPSRRATYSAQNET